MLAPQRPGLLHCLKSCSLCTQAEVTKFCVLFLVKQKCKVWIVENVAPSTARTNALAKYLGTLSKSLQDDGSRPSLKRRRLHLLYVINDVFHHVIVRKGDVEFATLWDNVLPSLIASAAAFNNCPKHKKKLADLIQLWNDKKYVNSEAIAKLENALASGVAPQTAQEPQVSNASIKLAKNAPFTLPSFHGDHTVPWYDLPATTWLPHLTPNSTKPMFPDQIRPIQLNSGPADKVLVNAVQDLLGEVERMFSKEQKWNDDPTNDLNELGERVVLDEITGDIIGGETYYGWSRQFCEKMKQRRKGGKGQDRGRSRSRSRSYSRGRSRSSSRPAHKRPRVTRDSRSRSPTRSRSRSYSRGHERSRNRRRSSSYNRSRSRSRGNQPERSRRRSYSRSLSRSPPRYHNKDPQDRPHRPPIPQQPQGHFLPVPPPGDFPLPPPPPAGYQGPWPPPPPPPQMAQGWFPPNPAMMGQMMGWNVPPPPPPQSGFQGRGRGNGYRGRGRGGYDRGRGW